MKVFIYGLYQAQDGEECSDGLGVPIFFSHIHPKTADRNQHYRINELDQDQLQTIGLRDSAYPESSPILSSHT